MTAHSNDGWFSDNSRYQLFLLSLLSLILIRHVALLFRASECEWHDNLQIIQQREIVQIELSFFLSLEWIFLFYINAECVCFPSALWSSRKLIMKAEKAIEEGKKIIITTRMIMKMKKYRFFFVYFWLNYVFVVWNNNHHQIHQN